MTPRLTTAWILVLAACTTALVATGSRAAHARQRASAVQSELLQVATDLQELAHLKEAVEPHLATARTQPLSIRVSAAAARAGLPSSCISSVSPEAQSRTKSENGLRILRRRATVTLGSITLPHLGKLLNAWRRTDTDWIVTAIDINPSAAPRATVGGDLPLSVVLTLESVGVDDTGAAQ